MKERQTLNKNPFDFSYMDSKNSIEVSYMDSMGTDLTVVNAARVSFNTHTNAWREKDYRLIEYLAKHNHWSPFSHCHVQFRVKAPIFVARQLAKHQVGMAWNEISRRYVDTYPEFFKPDEWRGRAASNKQGSEGAISDQKAADDILAKLHGEAIGSYENLLSLGVAPEQARMVLPQSTHTEWYWSGSLYAFARVCNQRLDHHSQAETAEVAYLIDCIISELFPVSWPELLKYSGVTDTNHKQGENADA